LGLPLRGARIRILHLGNTANVPRTLSDAQKKIGHEARVVATQEDRFRHEAEEILSRSGPLGWNLAVRELQVDWQALGAIHIHGGIWRSQLYYYLLRRRTPHSAWVVHLHGSEARSGKGLHHLGLADEIVWSTPDLRRFSPRGQWLPNPVFVPRAVAPVREGQKPALGHFPSDRRVKGTARLLAALRESLGPPKAIIREGTTIERWSWDAADLVIAERIPHEEVLRRMESCDAIIDHLSNLGPVGLVSLEAMARGRAALSCYDATAYPPDCPVIRLTIHDAAQTLGEAIADRGRLASAGAAGREYVRKLHDPQRIAVRSIEIYESVLQRRAR